MNDGKAPHNNGQRLGPFIWSVADLLRGDYKPAEYRRVILPFTVLRRLDCILAKTKPAVLKVASTIRDLGNLRADDELRLQKASGFKFYSVSKFDFAKLVDDAPGIRNNIDAYVNGFSANVRDIFDRYKFDEQVARLDEKNLLYQIVLKFGSIDLHPNVVTNHDMGTVFEYLIRKFNELSNETAGEHYTPRDAIHLLVDLLLAGDADLLVNPKPLRTVYDPAAGTGGMLSVTEDRIKEYNKDAKVTAYAQELNDETYAICKADMLFKGQDITNVKQGDTLSDDKFPGKHFDLMACNPPYGFEWKKEREAVEDEHERLGFKGRFGPELPRISDGQLLFLLHLVSKMRPVTGGAHGSRIGIVMNGSPLFTGGAGSGESEIRRYLLENDFVECIVGLPTEMFYNTGIATYIWILTNNKSEERKGNVQLIDATQFFGKMPRSLGNKRRYLSEENIGQVLSIYQTFEDGEYSKVLPNKAFGYTQIVVERPLRLDFQASSERIARLDEEKVLTKEASDLKRLRTALADVPASRLFKSRVEFLKSLRAALKNHRVSLRAPQLKAVWQCLSERDETGDVCLDAEGAPESDSELRDTENVPLDEDINGYFDSEVRPYASDAWMDRSKDRIGYGIPFTRYFYKYVPPRPVEEIDAELKAATDDIVGMLSEVTA